MMNVSNVKETDWDAMHYVITVIDCRNRDDNVLQ